HAPQGLAARHAVECFQAQCVFAQRERSLVAERAVAQAAEVFRLQVVRAVDDAQVLTTADLQARLGDAVRQADKARGRLDDHALSPGAGQFLPPGNSRRRVLGADDDPAGRGDQRWVERRETVGQLEVPEVRAVVVDRAVGRQELEGGEADPVQAGRLPAVTQVRLGERIRVGRAGTGAVEQVLEGQATPDGRGQRK